jgi:hypothetical protein
MMGQEAWHAQITESWRRLGELACWLSMVECLETLTPRPDDG